MLFSLLPLAWFTLNANVNAKARQNVHTAMQVQTQAQVLALQQGTAIFLPWRCIQ